MSKKFAIGIDVVNIDSEFDYIRVSNFPESINSVEYINKQIKVDDIDSFTTVSNKHYKTEINLKNSNIPYLVNYTSDEVIAFIEE